jgi:peroxiredoxin
VKWKDKHDGGFPSILKKITSNDQLQIVQIASDFPFAQKKWSFLTNVPNPRRPLRVSSVAKQMLVVQMPSMESWQGAACWSM